MQASKRKDIKELKNIRRLENDLKKARRELGFSSTIYHKYNPIFNDNVATNSFPKLTLN